MWAAHEELATCKPLGFGCAGPIPWMAIHEYAAHHGLTWEEEAELAAYVWTIDAELNREESRGD